jgi:DNA-binding MarR family transcriptional regulator
MSLMLDKDRENSSVMTQIIWTIPRIYHRLTEVSESIYSCYNLTAGKRSLLNDLNFQGPHTIADMVKKRAPITRQYIHRLVTELKLAGLVNLVNNEKDQRSKIVQLSDKGKELLVELAPVEQAFSKHLAAGQEKKELEIAHKILISFAKCLEQGNIGDQLKNGQ